MEINVILQAISTVGFPIVVAGAMFWKMNKQDEVHKEELNKVTEAITNNTIALTQLIDKLNNSGG
jgi:cytidylate kinase